MEHPNRLLKSKSDLIEEGRMDVIKSQQISSRSIEKVIVHPLVLLSVVDHYNHVARDTKKRVISVLLGNSSKGTVDVTNSYGVPFEEDDKDPSLWFLDHDYHGSIFSMFRRINAKEHVVGWYITGPKLRENDLNIHALFNDYVPTPVLVIIDVQPNELGIPTKAYYVVEEVKENATQDKTNLIKEQLLQDFLPDDVCPLGAQLLTEIPGQMYQFGSNESKSLDEALDPFLTENYHSS